jgi:hypothetical protein
MRKFLAAAIAVVSLAVPTAANAASLTVSQQTDAADTASFGFHTEFQAFSFDNPGPFTFHPPDFALTAGTSKPFSNLHKGFYTITQALPAGWKLVSITCTADPDPTDAPVITGGNVRLELSSTESKTCTFVNAKVVTPPSPAPAATPAPAAPPAPAASPAPAAPPAPASAVLPVRAVNAKAALQAPNRCVSRMYTVAVVGGPLRSVTFSVNGKRQRTIQARAGQRRFSLHLGIRSRLERVTARVTFRSNASPRTRTLHATVRRCAAAQVRPQFTG